jgi:hypothetical protein
MNSTPQPPTAAGEHFADAERLLAALPLATKRGERDRDIAAAQVHATLSIAATLLGAAGWQAIVETADGEQDTP